MVKYSGIDALDSDHRHELIFGVQIGFTNSARNCSLGEYSLHLHREEKNYYARTEIHRNQLDEIMEAHLGPK